MNQIDNIRYCEDMIKSCFAYGSAEKGSYYFEQYIAKYKKQLGTELFNEVYDRTMKDLQENYTIQRGVYTDGEGCAYNSLVKK
jgi:hypothetical protein